jgi:hypothetical protein
VNAAEAHVVEADTGKATVGVAAAGEGVVAATVGVENDPTTIRSNLLSRCGFLSTILHKNSDSGVIYICRL